MKVLPRDTLVARERTVMVEATLRVSLFHFISGWVSHLSLQGRGTLLPSLFLKYSLGKLFAPKSTQMAAEGVRLPAANSSFPAGRSVAGDSGCGTWVGARKGVVAPVVGSAGGPGAAPRCIAPRSPPSSAAGSPLGACAAAVLASPSQPSRFLEGLFKQFVKFCSSRAAEGAGF